MLFSIGFLLRFFPTCGGTARLYSLKLLVVSLHTHAPYPTSEYCYNFKLCTAMSIDVIMDDVLIFMIAIKIWGKAGETIGFCPKILLVIFS